MYILNNFKRLLNTFRLSEIILFRKNRTFIEVKKLNNEILDELEKTILNHTKKNDPELFSNGSDKRWFNLKKENPEIFNKIIKFSGVKELIDEELKDYEYFVMYGNIKYSSRNSGSGDGYHFDSTFFQRKLIYYLSEANIENGCFQYLPQTSKINFIRKHIIKNIFSKNILRLRDSEVENYTKINVEGKKGDGFYIKTSSVHRGNPLKIGERKALFFYLFNHKRVPYELKKYI